MIKELVVHTITIKKKKGLQRVFCQTVKALGVQYRKFCIPLQALLLEKVGMG